MGITFSKAFDSSYLILFSSFVNLLGRLFDFAELLRLRSMLFKWGLFPTLIGCSWTKARLCIGWRDCTDNSSGEPSLREAPCWSAVQHVGGQGVQGGGGGNSFLPAGHRRHLPAGVRLDLPSNLCCLAFLPVQTFWLYAAFLACSSLLIYAAFLAAWSSLLTLCCLSCLFKILTMVWFVNGDKDGGAVSLATINPSIDFNLLAIIINI